VAFTNQDAAAAAKILHDSFKSKELPRIKAFIVDGEIFRAEAITRLAELPPKEVLLSQIIAGVQAPIANVVNAINGIFQGLLSVIQALADKRANAGEQA
jgi:large subunit ribosomal protein L10